MTHARKAKRAAAGQAVDSTMVLGDLTDVTQITRKGKVVTLHGHNDPRSIALPTEQLAASFWQALATEASSAVEEDRQFFCVSFGAASSEGHDATVH